jgi:hypothetical protein
MGTEDVIEIHGLFFGPVYIVSCLNLPAEGQEPFGTVYSGVIGEPCSLQNRLWTILPYGA